MPDPSPFAHITDPELRKKLEETVASHSKSSKTVPPEVNQRPRFVFSRVTSGRNPKDMVKVRNGLDENYRGGTILEQVGRAYRVDIDGEIFIVHEPEDSWE